MTNLELLLHKYNKVTLNMEELAEVLNMKYTGLMYRVENGTCPVQTYRPAKRRIANVVDVAKFLDSHNG